VLLQHVAAELNPILGVHAQDPDVVSAVMDPAEREPVLFSQREAGSPFQIEFVPVESAGEPQTLEHEELRFRPLS
jgi:hypothetical protein